MSVDLSDLIDLFTAAVSAPGVSLFPNATDDDYLNYLRNAFWESVLDGIVTGYTESDGVVSPIDVSSPEFSRTLQQVVILYASIDAIVNYLITAKTEFHAEVSGIVYETQTSAQVLKGLLDELTKRRSIVLTRLSDLGSSQSFYIDAVIARDYAIRNNATLYLI